MDILVPIIMYSAIGFIGICIFGAIMKHFIREAIKDAYEEMGMYKRK